MKIYLSCDIEGSAGAAHSDECNKSHPDYEYFRQQMTNEAAAACRGAILAGADDILVRDAHGTARNIIPSVLPEAARIIRGGKGDLYAMMTGIEKDGFDAAMMTGFHSGAGTNTSPLSHTFNRKTDYILLNGCVLSEFLYNAYTAAYFNVPVPFVSGDKGICDFAKDIIPGINTVATQEGIGNSTLSIHPDSAVKKIEKGVFEALSGDYTKCKLELPKKFNIKIRYISHTEAYFNSFYSGVKQLDEKTIQYEADDYIEILRLVHFVLDK